MPPAYTEQFSSCTVLLHCQSVDLIHVFEPYVALFVTRESLQYLVTAPSVTILSICRRLRPQQSLEWSNYRRRQFFSSLKH